MLEYDWKMEEIVSVLVEQRFNRRAQCVSNDTFNFGPCQKLLERNISFAKRGISSIIPPIWNINGENQPYILRGTVILSGAWAYEKPTESSDKPCQSRPKPLTLDRDESLPEHLDKEFRSWINDIEIIVKYIAKRYLFGCSDDGFEVPPPRKELNLKYKYSLTAGNMDT